MKPKFLFFNGVEDKKERETHLKNLNKPLREISKYDFFRTGAGIPIHKPTMIDKWMAEDPPEDEVIIALLHLNNFEDIVTSANKWNSNQKKQLFILLFSGGPANFKMRSAAKELAETCSGAWALEKGFTEFKNSPAWINLHRRLVEATTIEEIKSDFVELIPAINDTNEVDTNSPLRHGVKKNAESNEPKDFPLKVLPVQLGFALETLLKATLEPEDDRFAGSGGLSEKLADRAWWRRGLSDLGKGDLKKVLEVYIKSRHEDAPCAWVSVNTFLDKIFSDTEQGLLEAAHAAHKALRRG